MKTKNTFIIVGSLPPPYHGSNVMGEMTLRAFNTLGYNTIFIDKAFSKEIDNVGKISLYKIKRLMIIIYLIMLKCFRSKPSVCIYFIASGSFALIVDALILKIINWFDVPYILRFDGKGFRTLHSKNKFWAFIISHTLKNCFGGIVLGNRLKDDVSNFIPEERLFVIPNCINDDMPYESKGDRNSKIRVLFLSNLIESKGPLEVVKAAKIVTASTKNVQFVLAGAKFDVSFYKNLKKFISENNLDNYVTVIDPVYNMEKYSLYLESDIFVFPTSYEHETFGLVNIEAMQAGLPVITSSEGAIPEIVKDGITGFIIDPKIPNEIADKILLLIENHDLRKGMGEAGRNRYLSKYTPKQFIENWQMSIDYFKKTNSKMNT